MNPLSLFNDALDDTPDKVEADGFEGFDGVVEPTKLLPQIVRAGENVWSDVDKLLQTRPGLQFNTQLTRAALGGGSHNPRGAGYYDIPGFERVLVSGDAKLYEVTSDGNNVTSNVLTPVPSATAKAHFSQLVDRMFWSDGIMNWSMFSGGAWSHGTVTLFSDASAMPTWSVICSHRFRLLALDPATGKIYASAVGAASLAANWVPTENIRVGTGEGDPPLAIISGQGPNFFVICERSAYMVDASAASAANWTIQTVTRLAGAREGRTAILFGQDVLFLSAFGVVTLGGLIATDSITPAKSLSAPVQSYIDRINNAAISTAWATLWRDQYILAVPLDSATQPNYFLVFNTTTRRWAPPWKSTLPGVTIGGTPITFDGFVAAVVSNFSGNQETLIVDSCGRVLRFDRSFEKDASAAATTQEIVSWATCKAFHHDMPEAFKQPFWLEIEWYGSTASGVQVNLVRDGLKAYPDKALVNCEIIASGLGTNAVNFFPILFPLQFQANTVYRKSFHIRAFSRYRDAGIQIVASQGRLKLRAIRLASFIDSPPLSN